MAMIKFQKIVAIGWLHEGTMETWYKAEWIPKRDVEVYQIGEHKVEF